MANDGSAKNQKYLPCSNDSIDDVPLYRLGIIAEIAGRNDWIILWSLVRFIYRLSNYQLRKLQETSMIMERWGCTTKIWSISTARAPQNRLETIIALRHLQEFTKSSRNNMKQNHAARVLCVNHDFRNMSSDVLMTSISFTRMYQRSFVPGLAPDPATFFHRSYSPIAGRHWGCPARRPGWTRWWFI